MKIITEEFVYGKHTVKLETGRIARQATAAVVATMGKNVVLCTVVINKKPMPEQNFLPLTVNYQEKSYAGGRIPGSFFRREGRPSEKETLTSRLIDRPIRPLFRKGFMNEIQVICTVMSADSNLDPDIPAMFGAGAALALSGAPIKGIMAAARIGFVDNNYVLNPTHAELDRSALNMVLAGTSEAVLMVESDAAELSEDQMLGAILYGHQEMQVVIKMIAKMAAAADRPAWELHADPTVAMNTELAMEIRDSYHEPIENAYGITDRQERRAELSRVRSTAAAALADRDVQDVQSLGAIFDQLEKSLVRNRILAGKPRIDGRNTNTVRPIHIEVGLLPNAHGSTLFTRGETQSIATTTLGGTRDAAIVESLQETYKDSFLLHYNFPPYSVGETGFLGTPKRREIGHGRLARRAIERILPDKEHFPYTIRVVSDITESNGSSSMASVCAASLALMDAGVPVQAPVAGIAMGLVKEGDQFAILTDILGDEDHLGDMDFKVAGTGQGITALQMDIKIAGVSEAIMEAALTQARTARLMILAEMGKVLSEPRPEVSPMAPSFHILEVARGKLGGIIGKGGKNIRSITESTGSNIDVGDDGQVRIYAPSRTQRDAAIKLIMASIEDVVEESVEVGRIYRGEVKNITDFGAFVGLPQGIDGLLHISQIAHERVRKVSDYLQQGQVVDVKVLDVDQRGRIKLSIKEIDHSERAALPEL